MLKKIVTAGNQREYMYGLFHSVPLTVTCQTGPVTGLFSMRIYLTNALHAGMDH